MNIEAQDTTITFTRESWDGLEVDWLVLGVPGGPWPAPLRRLNELLDGALEQKKSADELPGKLGEELVLPVCPGVRAGGVVLVGTGETERWTPAACGQALNAALRQVTVKPHRSVAVVLPVGAKQDEDALRVECELAAQAAVVAGVGQDLYKRERTRHPLQSLTLVLPESIGDIAAEASAEEGRILGGAINLVRELVNRPASDVYPETFAQRCGQLATEYGLSARVWDENVLREQRMGAMLAVAAGSERPPRLVMLEYRGADREGVDLVLVGKGVTFDSGGLSLKSNEHMLTMKCDMAGAATAVGALTAIAGASLPVNVRAYAGLVENLVSGRSYKLGDVLHARNGTTIEVHNTDAEGRLVLADVLSLAVDEGGRRLIDLATLTGACVVALGEDYTGLFSNAPSWARVVRAAAEQRGELVWEMPMDPLFDELLNSDVADVKNVGTRWGGAITAAKFLQRFVGDAQWVHLDIAGPAFASSSKPHREGGATGVMVRTLFEVARRVGSGGLEAGESA